MGNEKDFNTVGELRKAIEGLPDDARVCPGWTERIPADHEPGVRLTAFEVKEGDRDFGTYLQIGVALFYLNELPDEEEDEDEDEG